MSPNKGKNFRKVTKIRNVASELDIGICRPVMSLLIESTSGTITYLCVHHNIQIDISRVFLLLNPARIHIYFSFIHQASVVTP